AHYRKASFGLDRNLVVDQSNGRLASHSPVPGALPDSRPSALCALAVPNQAGTTLYRTSGTSGSDWDRLEVSGTSPLQHGDANYCALRRICRTLRVAFPH